MVDEINKGDPAPKKMKQTKLKHDADKERLPTPVESHKKPDMENTTTHSQCTLSHQQKNWKEYFIEFLLVFLAVTLGFIADSYREGLDEKSKEKEYIKSMIDDLKRDTSNFNFLIKKGRETSLTADSLILLFRLSNRNSHTSRMYYLARNITRGAFPFEIFDRTYSQMKTSGNLRLLHSQKIADSITSYYSDIQLLSSQQYFITTFLLDYIKTLSIVFDVSVLHGMYKEAGFTVYDNKQTDVRNLLPLNEPKGNPPLADQSNKAVNSLLGSLHYLYARILNVIVIVVNEKKKATNLLKLLQDEYDLK